MKLLLRCDGREVCPPRTTPGRQAEPSFYKQERKSLTSSPFLGRVRRVDGALGQETSNELSG